MKKAAIAIFCFFIYSFTSAQTTNMGSWNIADLFYKTSKDYTFWLEAQTRSQNLYTDFYYHELKAGVFYNFKSSHSSLFVGGGRYTTYSLDGNYKSPVTTEEFRIWEQLCLNNVYNHFNVEHRYRLEQRWVNNNFKPRIRYRINPTYAINHRSIVPKTFFVSVFDEIFLGNNNPHLERNRYYAGMGYQFSKNLTMQMGYMHQTDYTASGTETGKDFIMTTLIFYADNKLFKKDPKIPTIMD